MIAVGIDVEFWKGPFELGLWNERSYDGTVEREIVAVVPAATKRSPFDQSVKVRLEMDRMSGVADVMMYKATGWGLTKPLGSAVTIKSRVVRAKRDLTSWREPAASVSVTRPSPLQSYFHENPIVPS